jgi:adenylate kinase
MIRAALFGLPTAGKSTLSHLAAQRLGIAQINMGEALRRRGAAAAVTGEHVPDDVVVALARTAIDDSGGGFLLDGFPRTDAQLRFLHGYSGAEGCRFILLDLPRSRVCERFIARANCGRCRRAQYRGETCAICGGPVTLRPDANEVALARKLEAFDLHEGRIIESLRSDRLERLPVTGDTVSDAEHLIEILLSGGTDAAR